MSLIQFDDMYDICCEMMNEVKKGATINVKPPNERLDMKVRKPESDHWWEDAIQEILNTDETEENEVLVV